MDQTITYAQVGETFTVSRRVNPSTGFTWHLLLPEEIHLVNKVEVPEGTGVGVGTWQIVTWTFVAVAPGTFPVLGYLSRTWSDANLFTPNLRMSVVVRSRGLPVPQGAFVN